MFQVGCQAPPRHVHEIEGSGGGMTLIMPAWQTGGFLGIKTVNVFPGNQARALPGLFSTYTLYDAQTGEPRAMLDGNEITSRRTVAASALAASYVASPESKTQLIAGCGRVGSLVAHAYREVLPIQRVLTWDRDPEAARRLAHQLQTEGFDALAATDLAAAVGVADVVTCATLSTEPFICGAWLQPHAHLDLIGSFTPQMREAHDDCFRGAAIYIDTDDALRKSGDLLDPMSRGVFKAVDVVADLTKLARGEVSGRAGRAGRTVFKSVGTALEDLAAATLAYRS